MAVVVIFNSERDPRTGRQTLVASHGFDQDSGAAVTLPPDSPEALGARLDPALGEYVIAPEDNGSRERPRQ